MPVVAVGHWVYAWSKKRRGPRDMLEEGAMATRGVRYWNRNFAAKEYTFVRRPSNTVDVSKEKSGRSVAPLSSSSAHFLSLQLCPTFYRGSSHRAPISRLQQQLSSLTLGAPPSPVQSRIMPWLHPPTPRIPLLNIAFVLAKPLPGPST